MASVGEAPVGLASARDVGRDGAGGGSEPLPEANDSILPDTWVTLG